MKRNLLFLTMVISLIFLLSLTAFAVDLSGSMSMDSDAELIETEEELIGELDLPDTEQIEAVGFVSDRSIQNPQFPFEILSDEIEYEADPFGNDFHGTSTYAIGATNESTDKTILLDGLPEGYNTLQEDDAGGFKNIVNVVYEDGSS